MRAGDSQRPQVVAMKKSRLRQIFQSSGKCFIPFVTAGHPDLDATREIVLELARIGSHIIEVGIPFSDPIADGPVIQRASFEALQHGYRMSDYVRLVRQVREQSEVGLVFMTYLNPVLRYGLQRLDREAADAGLDGILISDLTPEEYQRLDSSTFQELDTIFLAAPTSSDERLKKIARVSQGFVYLVARTGVTGAHTDVGQVLVATLERLRRFTELPVGVGFGISSAGDVEKVWQHADGAIVGSALVRFIEEHKEQPDLPRQVGRYVRESLLPAP